MHSDFLYYDRYLPLPFDLTMFVEDTLGFKKYGAMPYRFEAILPTAKKDRHGALLFMR